MKSDLKLDVYFDLICPWCLIGKRHLTRALEMLREESPHVVVDLRWHSVQLLPGVPVTGLPFAEFYERRLGGKENVRVRQAQVTEAARQAGLDIALERIQTMPNTAKAHHALAFAAEIGDAAQHEAFLERLFAAYFVDGDNIGHTDTLARLATKVGIDGATIKARLDSLETAACELFCHQTIAGVPYFVFNDRHVISGAHPPETLYSAMCAALADSMSFAGTES